MKVSCGLCKIKFDRRAEPSEFISGKWHHERCAIQVHQKKELYRYICTIFNLKAPGPINFSMINKMVKEKGYTYVGIKNALKYHYEIKNGEVEKSEERIGIVPYVYDEAQNYFSNLSKKQDKVLKNYNEKKDKNKKIVVKMGKKKKGKTEEDFDLTSFFNE